MVAKLWLEKGNAGVLTMDRSEHVQSKNKGKNKSVIDKGAMNPKLKSDGNFFNTYKSTLSDWETFRLRHGAQPNHASSSPDQYRAKKGI